MKSFVIGIFFFLQFSVMAFTGDRPCPFCNTEIQKAAQVFENEYFRIFVDHAPIVKGHLLIIPKRHIMKADQLMREEWCMLGVLIPRVVRVFQQVFGADQYLILEKNGPLSGQTVPHVHFHMVPVASRETAEQVRQALFAKYFDSSPQKLTKEEMSYFVGLVRTNIQAE